MARELKVEIVGDASSLQRALGKAGDASDGFGSKFAKLGKTMAVAAGAAGAAVGVVAIKSINAASDLQEQLNKTAVVFGKNSDEVVKWSKGLTQSFGLSQRAALEAAGTYGNMLVPMGFSRKEAGKMSKQFVELAGDMASFNNASPEETLDALRAGLAGETEPLRRYGVFLNDARIKQEAAAQGAKLVKGQLDAQSKAAAVAAIIMKDTADTQGDFARSAGTSLANQLRIAKAEIENVGAAIGAKLLPFAIKLLQFINAAIPVIATFVGKISDIVGPLIQKGFGAITDQVGQAGNLFQTFGQIFSDVVAKVGPIISELGRVAVEAFQSIARVLQQNAPQLRQIFDNLGTIIRNLATIIIPILEFAFTKVLPVAIRVLIPILVALTGIMATYTNAMRVVAQFVTGTLAPAFTRAFNTVKSVVAGAVAAITPIIQGVAQIIRGVINVVVGIFTGDWSRAWDRAKTAVSTAINGIKAYLQTVPALILKLAVAVGQAILEGILSGLAGLGSLVKDKIVSELKGAVSLAGSILHGSGPFQFTKQAIGWPMAQGVIEGWNEAATGLSKAMTEKLKAAVEAGAQAISDSKSKFEAAFSELTSLAEEAFDKMASAIKTKSEKALAAFDAKKAAQQLKDALADANKALAEARQQQAALDPANFASPEEFAAAQAAATQAVLAAEQQRQDALDAIKRANLERQAAAERADLDNRLALKRKHFGDELLAIQNAYSNGKISAEQFHQRLIGLFKEYKVPYQKGAKDLGLALAEGLNDSYKTVERSARDLAKVVLDAFANIKIILNVDLSVKNKPADERAVGGPVRQGAAYLVGERGPELFIPSVSGQIIPNGSPATQAALVGAGTSITLNFNGPTVGTSREFEDTVRRALYDVQRRNPGSGL